MKIKVITSILLGIFIVLLSTVAFAATGTVELKSNVSEIKKGETFKVTLSATSQDGINGIDAKYNYDSEKLELVNEKVVNTTNWSNIGSANNITIINNSTESIKSADLYELEFKVKDSVATGSVLKVEMTQILLDTDAQTNSEVNIETKKVEVTVKDNSNPINTVTGTVELKSNVTEVKKGETFKVTLSAASENGINGVETKFVYDSSKLELVKEKLIDSTNWSNIGTFPNITIISNSEESMKRADLYELEFKVKDSVTVGSTVKVETTQILLDTDSQTNSEINIEAKKVEVKIKDNSNNGNNNNNNNNNNNANNNGSGSNSGNNNSGTATKNTTTSGSGTTSNSTISTSKSIPKAGKEILGVVLMIVLVGCSVVSYILYKKSK